MEGIESSWLYTWDSSHLYFILQWNLQIKTTLGGGGGGGWSLLRGWSLFKGSFHTQ